MTTDIRQSPYGYALSLNGIYILALDDKEISRGTEEACWRWIHSNTSGSVSYALEFGGYTITPEFQDR
jgi:hypothetical protein